MSFHVGQLVVCVDDHRIAEGDLKSPEPLVIGQVYPVLWCGISSEGRLSVQVQQSDIDLRGCWLASNFRPAKLADLKGGRELLSLLNTNPDPIPAATGDDSRCSADDATGPFLPGRVHSSDADAPTVRVAAPIPASGGKPHEDGVDQGSYLDSHR